MMIVSALLNYNYLPLQENGSCALGCKLSLNPEGKCKQCWASWGEMITHNVEAQLR